MEIADIVWLDVFVEKLWKKHKVTMEEVEDVFDNQPAFYFAEKGKVRNEHVYSAWGRTDAGRYLIVFFVYKKDKKALILSARDMDGKERRKYERKK